MARFVVAGGGVVGASIAYQLALRGAKDVVLADIATIASGASGKALGGVRQQFSSAPEVLLARESVAFFNELGPELFEPVGYLFLATSEAGLVELEERREVQAGLGVPVERVDAARVPGLNVDDVLGAVFCGEDGTADPAAVTQELARRAGSLGVDVREETDALELDDRRARAGNRSLLCRPIGAKLGIELPVRPLVRQLVETAPIQGLSRDLPLTIESESGFHFRRRGDALLLALPEPAPRWDAAEVVDDDLVAEKRARIAHRFPAAAGVAVARAWAGLYDMTPDAHPIIGPVAPGRLRRLRVLGSRLHAGTRGRTGRCRRAPRRWLGLRPDAVSPRAFRGRRDRPRNGDPVEAAFTPPAAPTARRHRPGRLRRRGTTSRRALPRDSASRRPRRGCSGPVASPRPRRRSSESPIRRCSSRPPPAPIGLVVLRPRPSRVGSRSG